MIYFIKADGVGHIKIGYTDGEDADARIATLQTGSPVPLRLLHTMPGTMEDEKNLHRRFAAHSAGGEWFKAVPELMSLVPPADDRRCEGVEIAERSVSIRVLTVGRKQFSKSLLSQLQKDEAISWRSWISALRDLEDRPDPAHIIEAHPLIDFVERDIWGWIDTDEQMPAGVESHSSFNFSTATAKARTVIFKLGDRLMKSKEPHFRAPLWLLGNNGQWERECVAVAWKHSWTLPGLRDQDQLFFGV